MLYSSKGLALISSLAISIAAGLFLYLFLRPDINLLLLVSLITFLTSGVLIFFLLESIIFSGINKVKEAMRTPADDAQPFGSDTLASNNLKEMLSAITSLSEAQKREIDQLRKQETFRKELIADISHELKTPIFAAQGFVHTLLDGAAKEKAVRKRFLKKAAKSLDGLDMLVQDLLTLSQIEMGQISMRFEDVDLFALTEDVFDQLRKQSDKKDITLQIKGPVRKVMAYADGYRISQVMLNLISNAIKHSLTEGKIEVSFLLKKQSVITIVKDYGEGIPKEHIPRIFERFYRVDKSRSREKGGTGLGLAIVKHILEGHNSRAKVESAPGEGTTFRFRLPRASNEAATYGAENTDSEESSGEETAHVIS